MCGANIGAAGDSSSAAGFSQGQGAQTVNIDGHGIDSVKLVTELQKLRESIAQSNTQDPDSISAQKALSEAEDAARSGNSERVKASLARLGRWVLRLAEATGAAVAAEAIKRASGW
jgi:hypothetical protein